MATISVEDYKALIGKELGVSRWVTVDQSRINAFADCTEDHQFIHVDEARAARTPFGGTIAHGFLSLSLLAGLAGEVFPEVAGTRLGLNYGLNKIRFITPVLTGKRVRGRFKLLDVLDRHKGVLQSTYEASIEIEGEDKPALVAEWIGLIYL